MISSKNTVSLYRIARSDILEKTGFSYRNPLFKYNSNNKTLNISLDEEYENTLFIHEIEPNWSPDKHKLIIEQKLTFNNPSYLFGKNGVTNENNKIGVAAHIHSRTTNYQEKISFGTIENTNQPTTLPFTHQFEKNTLRGEVNIEFFLYLEELNVKSPLQADQKGLRLSENLIPTIVIVIDGIGSAFPIIEINDSKAPLWEVEKNWADPFDDPFDASNVHLKINIAHSEFKRLKEERTILSRLYMGEIMCQVMAAVINDVLNNSQYTLNDADNAAPDSIISIVKYWVETFDVNTTDYFTIINTLKSSLENSFR